MRTRFSTKRLACRVLSDIVKRRSFRANGTVVSNRQGLGSPRPFCALLQTCLRPTPSSIGRGCLHVKSAKLDRCRRRFDLEAKLVFLISVLPVAICKSCSGPTPSEVGH